MYQIEVKKYLIEYKFSADDGWEIYSDIDSMEMAKGGTHPPGKKEIAIVCKQWMENKGVLIGAHPKYGRADIVAKDSKGNQFIIEVEGDTSRQPEQALYSALGQTILQIKQDLPNITYGLAVPDDMKWECQLIKIPSFVLKALKIKLFLVSPQSVRELN